MTSDEDALVKAPSRLRPLRAGYLADPLTVLLVPAPRPRRTRTAPRERTELVHRGNLAAPADPRQNCRELSLLDQALLGRLQGLDERA
jgi:hypothetical protein